MDAEKVVDQLWARMQARDWTGLGSLIAEDAVVDWIASGERIIGRKNFVAVNSEYPEGWSIRVQRIISSGEEVVSEVEVPLDGAGLFRVVSFWTVRQGQIVSGREYWSGPGLEEPPAWRLPYVERIPDTDL